MSTTKRTSASIVTLLILLLSGAVQDGESKSPDDLSLDTIPASSTAVVLSSFGLVECEDDETRAKSQCYNGGVCFLSAQGWTSCICKHGTEGPQCERIVKNPKVAQVDAKISRNDELDSRELSALLSIAERQVQEVPSISPRPSQTPQPSSTPYPTHSHYPSYISYGPSVSWSPTITARPTTTWYPSQTWRPSVTWYPTMTAHPTISPFPSMAPSPSSNTDGDGDGTAADDAAGGTPTDSSSSGNSNSNSGQGGGGSGSSGNELPNGAPSSSTSQNKDHNNKGAADEEEPPKTKLSPGAVFGLIFAVVIVVVLVYWVWSKWAAKQRRNRREALRNELELTEADSGYRDRDADDHGIYDDDGHMYPYRGGSDRDASYHRKGSFNTSNEII